MTPLDLSGKPPRHPHADLGGVVFLARSIDKLRASLPGGDLGLYGIRGFTERMLDQLGITQAAITAAVAAAAGDEDVLAFVRAHTTQDKIDAWNAYAQTREPSGGDRTAALKNYPWLHERPDLIFALDVLAEDDKRTFPARA